MVTSPPLLVFKFLLKSTDTSEVVMILLCLWKWISKQGLAIQLKCKISKFKGKLDIISRGKMNAIKNKFENYTNRTEFHKTDSHDIAEILLKVALNTIALTPCP
jgi:hypothetical protein